MTDLVDPAQCPLCGNPNQCGIAAGKGTCWCFSQRIPQAALDKVPEEARDEVCVCERCAAAAAKA